MNPLETMIAHFFARFRSIDVRRPRPDQMRYFRAWQRAVRLKWLKNGSRTASVPEIAIGRAERNWKRYCESEAAHG